MPSTYLCRGFRWHRDAIRIYIMMNDLEECAPDWIIGWTTSEELLKSFYRNFDFLPEGKGNGEPSTPAPMARIEPGNARFSVPEPRTAKEDDVVLKNSWSAVKVLEEYDDNDLTEHTRPYAFVADYVVRVELDVDVNEEMAKMGTMLLQDDHAWFERLNRELQPDETIKWYIVVVADELRSVPSRPRSLESQQTEPQTATTGERSRPSSNGSTVSAGKMRKSNSLAQWKEKVAMRKKSVKNLFQKKEKPEKPVGASDNSTAPGTGQ